ncbi:MAG: M28 family peptidase [Gemmatimonadota bacterium]|nr:M28 family peptidase [Gemmatimonadota bacterium]
MRIARRNTSVVLLAFLFPACATEVADPAPHNDAITAGELSADLHHLASDAMRGRLAGTAGIAEAAEWIAGRFGELGLEPAGTEGYFEPFDLNWFTLGTGNTLAVVSGDRRARAPGDGWYPLNVSASASAEGEVVYSGYGIVEPRISWDDYRGADVSGKVVLVLEREPGPDDPESPFDGVVTSEASRDWRKVLSAQERGAVGVLFVRDVHRRDDADDYAAAAAAYWPDEPRRIERFTLGVWRDRVRIPVAQVSAALASALVEPSGRRLEELAAAAEAAPGGFGVVALPGTRVALTTAVERHVTPGRNVLAMVEGSDPALRDQVVIVAAHHDHNGADGDEVFNGADDDGSGTIGVLAVAKAYALAAAEGRRPRRTVLFAVWDAEERGLLGAWYHTEHPRFPLDRVAAVLNMDMIGRDEEVPEDGGARFRGLEPQTAESNANAMNLLGYTRTPQLSAVVQEANGEYGLELKLRYDNNASNLLRRSDHWPFLQNGVPALWFHTGLHPDYHTPLDDADRVGYPKMERIVRLVHRASWSLADGDGRPAMGPHPMGGGAGPE